MSISTIHLVGSPWLTRKSGTWFKIQKYCLCLAKEILFLKQETVYSGLQAFFSMWIHMNLFTIVSPTRAVRSSLKTLQDDAQMIADYPPARSTALSICYTNSIVCFSETKFRIRQCCVGLFFFFNVDFRFEMFQRMAFKSFCKIVSSMSLTFNVPFNKSLYLLSHSDQHSHNPLLD